MGSARPLFDFDECSFSSFTDDLQKVNMESDTFEQLSF